MIWLNCNNHILSGSKGGNVVGIPVKLEVFEGPLDLLLHLIDKNKIDIYDIPIVLITEQYMKYVEMMDKKDLDVMSEFLVMAATLLNIKSKMLLPKEEKEEEGEEADPRQELVERLLEYKMYKYASLELKDRQLDASYQLYKKPTIPKAITDYKEKVDLNQLLEGVTLGKLHTVFRSIMKKQVDKIDPVRSTFGKIEKEEITLSDKMIDIDEYARLHGCFSFRKLIENQRGKIHKIVAFLGILELMKMGRLVVEQKEVFADILISYKETKVPLEVGEE